MLASFTLLTLGYAPPPVPSGALSSRLCGEHQLVGTDQRPVTREILEATRVIIEDRVRATGVADPVVRTQGADRISVEPPGAGDWQQQIRM